MANVRPMPGVKPLRAPPVVRREPAAAEVAKPVVRHIVGERAGERVGARKVAAPRAVPGTTLDGSWDKQLARGLVSPDRSIDLHGHNLGSAYALLDTALDQAIREGDRVILLVTGKPPRPESERPHARGAIRAAVGDWLAGSRHAASIAAVRGAHPRHGGAGALYIVLRRTRACPQFPQRP